MGNVNQSVKSIPAEFSAEIFVLVERLSPTVCIKLGDAGN